MEPKKEATELSIDQAVEKDIDSVKKIISQTKSGTRAGTTLYELVTEELSDGTRNTSTQIEYLSAFERAVSAFRCAAYELRKQMDVLTLEQRLRSQQTAAAEVKKSELEKIEPVQYKETVAEQAATESTQLKQQITDAKLFSNRYALFFAGQIGLALLNLEKTSTVKNFTFGDKYDASTEKDVLAASLAKVATEDLKDILNEKKSKYGSISDEDIKYTLEHIFTTWINQFSWQTFKDVAEKYGTQNLKIKYSNYSVLAGEFKKRYDIVVVDDRFMSVNKEDVIGNKEFVKTIYESGIRLLGYNHEKKKNPLRPPTVIFTFGQPGCGKTFGAHACVQAIAEEARKRGIPLKALTHSVTDYASHYQNLTANKLNSLVEEIREWQGPVLMYVADADIIFMSRKDPQITQEQRQTNSVYMKMFDGSVIPKNGKFIAIMDANYIDGIDDATKSRVFDVILELKRFGNAEDFSELARRTLTKGTNGIRAVTEQDWRELGGYLLQSQLSNREVTHVLDQLYTGFKIDESILDKPYEEQEAFVVQYLESLSKGEIINRFDTYIRTRLEIEENSRNAKIEADYKRFVKHLSMPHSGTSGANK